MGPKQIIVRLPNKPGQLARISELLGENGIDVKAVSISSEGDCGVLALVANDHAKALMILRASDIPAEETQVIASYAPDHPGGLKAVLKPLREAKVNIERLYLSAARKEEYAVLIIQVDDYEKGVNALKDAYVDLIEGEFRF